MGETKNVVPVGIGSRLGLGVVFVDIGDSEIGLA
jgi:hypothetical protein